jgi:hypothetical protein
MAEQTFWEKIEIKGGELITRLKDIVAEGNVRRIRITQRDRVVAEFPLSVGVVGVVFAPVLAAVGAMVALASDCTLEVERIRKDEAPPSNV